jgi:hypothetical protein
MPETAQTEATKPVTLADALKNPALLTTRGAEVVQDGLKRAREALNDGTARAQRIATDARARLAGARTDAAARIDGLRKKGDALVANAVATLRDSETTLRAQAHDGLERAARALQDLARRVEPPAPPAKPADPAPNGNGTAER